MYFPVQVDNYPFIILLEIQRNTNHDLTHLEQYRCLNLCWQVILYFIAFQIFRHLITLSFILDLSTYLIYIFYSKYPKECISSQFDFDHFRDLYWSECLMQTLKIQNKPVKSL